MKKIQAFDKGIYNPFKSRNVEININQATKENKEIFKEDYFNTNNPKKWEVRYDNSYPNVFYDPYIKKYRAYYSTFTTDKGSSNFTLEERQNNTYQPSTDRVVSLCYAESDDGVKWVKPNLGLTSFNGSKNNNIIGHYLHGTSVFIDDHEMNPKKRYKLFTKIDYGNGIHYLAVAFSDDGLHFDNFIPLDNFNPRADTHNSIYFDEHLQKYLLVTRKWRDSMRISCMSTSRDFINWTSPEEILQPRGYNNQIYSMPIFDDGDYQLGLASMYHEGDMDDPNFDKVDLELTYSYKHRGWNYVAPNQPFIERGHGDYVDGIFDNSVIFSALPVKIGDRTYFYYMGGNGSHTDFRETTFARAYIEHDRYAYIAPKDASKTAQINTNGFVFLSEEMYMDAVIEEGGYINIELYTFDHKKVEGIDVTLEKIDHRYRIQLSQPLNRQIVRLMITLNKSRIYNFQGDIEIYRVEDDNSLLRL